MHAPKPVCHCTLHRVFFCFVFFISRATCDLMYQSPVRTPYCLIVYLKLHLYDDITLVRLSHVQYYFPRSGSKFAEFRFLQRTFFRLTDRVRH